MRKASHPDAGTEEQRARAGKQRDVDAREGKAGTGVRGIACTLAALATTGARRTADTTLVTFDILFDLSLGAITVLCGLLRERRRWKYQRRNGDHDGQSLLEVHMH